MTLNDQIEVCLPDNSLVGVMLLLRWLAVCCRSGKRQKKMWATKRRYGWGLPKPSHSPEISRSGATISTSVLLGIDREKISEIFFFMVVPLILERWPKTFFLEFFHAERSMVSLGCGFVAAFLQFNRMYMDDSFGESQPAELFCILLFRGGCTHWKSGTSLV